MEVTEQTHDNAESTNAKKYETWDDVATEALLADAGGTNPSGQKKSKIAATISKYLNRKGIIKDAQDQDPVLGS